jgi:hypothetical protein
MNLKILKILRTSKAKLPKVDCEQARKIIMLHETEDRDLAVASCLHLIKCRHCLSWVNHNPGVVEDLAIIKQKIEADNIVHPEHRRNI